MSFISTARSLKKLPPIAALRGDRPDDLSDDELADIWSTEAQGQ